MDPRHWLRTRLTPARLAFLYVLVSAIWVVASSELLLLELHTPAAITAWEVFKGLLFITASGALIYWVTRRLLDGLLRSEHALRESEEQRHLVERRLLQSQKLEGIGRLAGGIAHDFNNILNVIVVSAKLLQEGIGEGPAQSWLKNIREAADRGSTLTRQLFAFGRREVVQLKPLDLNRVIRESTGVLSPLFGETVNLEMKLDPALWTVMADDSQVTQLLMNLCLNGRDAMSAGGAVEITTQNLIVGPDLALRVPEITPGPNVVLTVRDTGSGIRPELLDQIFEPFFTTKGNRGTGLGLSTVYGLVKYMGGGIDVRSELNKGTTFLVYLPRAAAIPAEDQPPSLTGDSSLAAGREQQVHDNPQPS